MTAYWEKYVWNVGDVVVDELVAAATAPREYVRYPAGVDVAPGGRGPGGGRFAPVHGEEAFTPEAIPSEDYVALREITDPQREAWRSWEDETMNEFGPVANEHRVYSMIAGETVAPDDPAIAKVAVQNRIAAMLEGDEDFKSLIVPLDPYGEHKESFAEGAKWGSADTVEKQVAAIGISTWARSSSDDDAVAIQFQIAAEQEFGLAANPYVHETWDAMAAPLVDSGGAFPDAHDLVGAVRFNEQQMRGARKFLRAQYELTQEQFEAAGVKEMVLYRGMAWKPGSVPAEIEGLRGQPPAIVAVHGNPMSSWATDWSSANGFVTKYDVKAISGTKVDVRRILSTPFTGFGCLNENEVVVLGGPDMDAMTWAWNAKYGRSDAEYKATGVYVEEATPGPGMDHAPPYHGEDAFIKAWQEQLRKRKP